MQASKAHRVAASPALQVGTRRMSLKACRIFYITVAIATVFVLGVRLVKSHFSKRGKFSDLAWCIISFLTAASPVALAGIS